MTAMQVHTPPSGMSIGQPAGRHVLHDPRPGQVLTVPPGSRLELRFRRGLVSRWHVEDRPGHLVPIEEGGHEFVFLVFDGPRSGSRPLRMVRRRTDRPALGEIRDLTVLVG